MTPVRSLFFGGGGGGGGGGGEGGGVGGEARNFNALKFEKWESC